MKLNVILAATAVLGGAAIALAQTMHTDHDAGMDHAAHGQAETADRGVLTEPGQGAFAALSEVVRVLEAAADTDWSRVELAGLRAHLVDMDRLVSDAVVTETDLPDGLLMMATGDLETIATLRRMVPAHAAQLARDDRWTVDAAEVENGVELRVTSVDPGVVARIKGLGFFGLMASQDHHREHHLMMAFGVDAHAH
ncbi:hypothetical protein Z946_598 [Sulfitobacter noctilucicola]|uniref:Uncharacterized protein n=1 Tax=Sulfitobacter noctilucicola TaxID=1342301 RepID=A0A7W6Q5K9_9RHOB|nr:hypothetical protein [Sulfitobacter noctilucicola]KIN66119.1 hypothetical protein Z946_598 [Sulfitobacter noctilucicola]MBB4175853.1 hypothetical protein [Sulfitobacter noctilucicola]